MSAQSGGNGACFTAPREIVHVRQQQGGFVMNHLHFLTAPGAVSAAIAVFPAQALPAPPDTYVSAQSQIFDFERLPATVRNPA